MVSQPFLLLQESDFDIESPENGSDDTNRSETEGTDEGPFEGGNIYECQLCLNHCENLKAATAHARSHSQKHDSAVRIFSCLQCSFSSPNPLHVVQHLRSSHGVMGMPAPRLFQCSKCSFGPDNKEKIEAHFRREHRTFQCPNCPFHTRWSTSLSQHRRTHTGEKPYRCSSCDYTCAYRTSLKVHLEKERCGKARPRPVYKYRRVFRARSLSVKARLVKHEQFTHHGPPGNRKGIPRPGQLHRESTKNAVGTSS